MPAAVDFFNDKLKVFSAKYYPGDLMKKISEVAKKAGCTTVYMALLMFYALADEKVPVTKKLTVIAALGYFIAPVDFIPDFVIGGLIDDSSVLLYALHQIQSYINEETERKAKEKLYSWFGEQDIFNLPKFKF